MSTPTEDTRSKQSYYDEQAEAWATFDENNGCKVCGAQVHEFNEILHHRWHQEQDR